MKRIPLRTLTLLLAPLAALPAAAAAPKKPNILVIVSDDQGYRDLGCNGGTLQTPNLDRLAAQGVRCTSFYAHPVCSPTRAAFFTGRHPLRTGMNNVIRVQDNNTAQLSASEVLLPAFLKRGSYATGLFGKWHLGFAPGARPTERGFDEFFGHAGGMINYHTHLGNDQKPDLWLGTAPVQREGYSTDLFADAACDFIRRRTEQPFFLCLTFNAPHSGSGVKGEIPAPEAFIKRYPTEPDRMRRTYMASVTAMDAAIGRVLDELEQQMLAGNTLVVFFSDNGGLNRSGGRNDPLRGEKGQAWEGGVRVPAIVRWPGKLPAGETCDEMLTVMDIFPLCLNAAGVGIPAPSERILDGRDPLPALAGLAPSPHDSIGFDVGARLNRQWAIRDRAGYKLVGGNKSGDTEAIALYDLAKDISEQNNLAAAQPERVAGMRAAFDQWRETVKRFNDSGQTEPSADKKASPGKKKRLN
jgi:arylsulfatase A-like enzyme